MEIARPVHTRKKYKEMKIHFGFIVDHGDYESPCIGCERTLCGYDTELPCENSTADWEQVTCKKCLRLKDRYILGAKEEEKAIVEQMGDMADFFSKNRKQTFINPRDYGKKRKELPKIIRRSKKNKW